jgi:acyl-CoA dehydrogenase
MTADTTGDPTTVVDPLLVETALRITEAHLPEPGAEDVSWSEALWRDLAGSGLTGVGIPEEAGGAGGTAADAGELVRISGFTAARVPLAETVFIAGPTLAAAGLAVPEGPLAVAPAPGELLAEPSGSGWRVSGKTSGVAWASVADHLVAVADGGDRGAVLVLVPLGRATVRAGRNLAGEPRDTVELAGVEVAGARIARDAGERDWLRRGATARALQIAGALERVLELTVRHAQERVQFTRPIIRFQAVGHLVAQLGEAVAQARMAAETAVAAGGDDDARVAKIIAGEAATRGAAMAHQVFGAMGTTRECPLHLYTRRLWSWRDEFGSEREWAGILGADLRDRGSEAVWSLITAAGPIPS